MFYGDDVFKDINLLSGGEKVRLKLSHILKKGPNLLLLDEPTNHMDILGKENLENSLKEYEGTLIFVSHDRFFIKKIADCLLVFSNGKVTYYDFGYEEYLSHMKNINEKEIQNTSNNANNNNNNNLNNDNKKIKSESKVEDKLNEKNKIYNNPLKEKGRVDRKIKKIEEDIIAIENKIAKLKEETRKRRCIFRLYKTRRT